MALLRVALFNYEGGGYDNQTGRYSFVKLRRAFGAAAKRCGGPFDLIFLCEAKRYRERAGEGKYGAAEALSLELGVSYVSELGALDRGPMPPAMFYDPYALVLRRWWDPSDANRFRDQENTAIFAVRGDPAQAHRWFQFRALVCHLEPLSGDKRLEEIRHWDRFAASDIPAIAGGDMNNPASGPHMPHRDYTTVPFPARSHKGWRNPETGLWVADTRAMDHAIGRWHEPSNSRVDGAGWLALAELAWQLNGKPIEPSVNKGVDVGGEQLIDFLLCNPAMAPHVIKDSYLMHPPVHPDDPESDHRLASVELDLPDHEVAVAGSGGDVR